MNFHATCRHDGLAGDPTFETTDATLFAAHMRADHKGGHKVRRWDGTVATGRLSTSVRRKLPTLIKDERAYLGLSVTLPNGTVGQVWALSPSKGYVWVSDGTTAHEMHHSQLDTAADAAA